MSKKADGAHAQLNQIEELIAALKREREGLERRFALLRKQRDFLDEASKLYFELWRLKWESSLEILRLSPAQRQLLEDMLGNDVVAQQLQVIEARLHRLVSEERYLTFAEIEGVLQIIDGIIERLENLRGQVAKRERPALQRAKKLVTKTVGVCRGAALISIDLPVLNWPSVIWGATLILKTVLDDE